MIRRPPTSGCRGIRQDCSHCLQFFVVKHFGEDWVTRQGCSSVKTMGPFGILELGELQVDCEVHAQLTLHWCSLSLSLSPSFCIRMELYVSAVIVTS